jgi:hypothetical protein
MQRQTNKMCSMHPARPELVMVALAEEASFARHFEKILRRDNIPVKVRNQHEPRSMGSTKRCRDRRPSTTPIDKEESAAVAFGTEDRAECGSRCFNAKDRIAQADFNRARLGKKLLFLLV